MTPRAYPLHNKEQFWFLRKSWVVWYPVSRLRNRVCSFLFMAGFGGTRIIQGMVGMADNPSCHLDTQAKSMKNVKKVWIPKSTTRLEMTSVCGSPLVAVKLRTACPLSSKCKIVQRAPWSPNECTGKLNKIHIQCVASCLANRVSAWLADRNVVSSAGSTQLKWRRYRRMNLAIFCQRSVWILFGRWLIRRSLSGSI